METNRNLKEYIQFLEDMDYSKHTIRNYELQIDGFIRWYEQTTGEEYTVSDVGPTVLREYKQFLYKVKKRQPATVNLFLASMQGYMKWAARNNHIKKVPNFPKPIKVQLKGAQWLTVKERNKLIRVVEQSGNVRDIAIIVLLLNTGLRLEELTALTWADIKITDRKGVLTVRHGKGGKYREIPLNNHARRVLFDLDDGKLGEETMVFHSQRGVLQKRGVQFIVNKYAKMCDFPKKVSVHSLRHTFCKHLADNNVSLNVIAQLAGHSDLNVTKNYLTPSVDDLQSEMDRVFGDN